MAGIRASVGPISSAGVGPWVGWAGISDRRVPDVGVRTRDGEQQREAGQLGALHRRKTRQKAAKGKCAAL